MPLVYITGPPGAGKSAMRRLLAERGYETHDTDEDGIARWFKRDTGEAATYPEQAADRTKEWAAQHEFLMGRDRVQELRARAKQSAVFLCGLPANGLEMADLFDVIVCLVIDQATMLNRVESRTTNSFGRAPAEKDLIVRHRQRVIDECREVGAVLVDASQPLDTVADAILSLMAGPGSDAEPGERPLA